jgi:dephospho-CoA kinase
VLLVGLTGGIGSGKSTVAAALARRGAVVIDADQVARQVVEPGGPAYAGVVERFGPGVLDPDGTLNRPALASVVFADPRALADLNAMTHPAIAGAIMERVAQMAGSDRVVVLEIPLLGPDARRRYPLDAVVVVDTPTDVAVDRLVAQRGLDREDARARVRAQISREERLSLADLVIDNAGDARALEESVSRAWEWLEERAGPAARPQ